MSILYPSFALALLTFVVLFMIPIRRVAAIKKGQAKVSDYALGEPANGPLSVQLPNRNLMNLLEVPVLFYVASLMIYVTQSHTRAMLTLAWVYVGCRYIHSAIHLTYNHVTHRVAAFALSNLALIALWVLLAAQLLNR